MASRGKPNQTGRSSGKLGGRRGEMLRPPQGQPWVWLTAELLASDAWQSLGINARRFIDFLLLEHMNHAGTENGNLTATHKQLEAFGMSVNHITRAIAWTEMCGLVDAIRGGMRVATKYRLTWLPTKAWEPATDRWKQFSKSGICPLKSDQLPPKQRADALNQPTKQRADATPQIEGPSYILEDSNQTQCTPTTSAVALSGRVASFPVDQPPQTIVAPKLAPADAPFAALSFQPLGGAVANIVSRLPYRREAQ